MRLPSRALALGLVLQAAAIQAWKITDGLRISYKEDDDEIHRVPSYNISIPIDHFNASDTRMFNNRYFINDTYYKPGGPVIFYDFGEAGVDDSTAAWLLGGLEETLSAPLELAKVLGGFVIGWEHRYYGQSRPFPVIRENNEYGGIPVGGAADYKYLTVKQALEDVVYFANRFNQTRLGPGNTVIAGENATQLLGPYHTPWIWVGASYPGVRGAWLRLHAPQIIYAVWASSAVTQIVPDGSAYSNSMFRALPKNCTSDMQAAVGRIDDILDSADHTRIVNLGRMLYIAEYGYQGDFDKRSFEDPYDHNMDVFRSEMLGLHMALISGTQSFGYTDFLQQFCDIMERFDAPSFLSNSSLSRGNDDDADEVFLWNEGGAEPSEKGIAASNGERGGEVALAAYFFAVNGYFGPASEGDDRKRSLSDRAPFERSSSTSPSSYYEATTYDQDTHAWEYQVLSELGLIIHVNGSSPYRIGSKYADFDYARKKTIQQYFSNFPKDAFPAVPDNDYPISFGGWRMQVSNTMFSNGEFDPWRAYSMSSLEHESDVSSEVPECGKADNPNGYFGIIYPGAVHAEDIAMTPGDQRGSQDVTHPPLKQGLELFLKSLDKWLPCFNSTRDQTSTATPTGTTPANSTEPATEPAKKNGAYPTQSAAKGAWAVAGVLSFLLYHAF